MQAFVLEILVRHSTLVILLILVIRFSLAMHLVLVKCNVNAMQKQRKRNGNSMKMQSECNSNMMQMRCECNANVT